MLDLNENLFEMDTFMSDAENCYSSSLQPPLVEPDQQAEQSERSSGLNLKMG
jgi:hypothetical protein